MCDLTYTHIFARSSRKSRLESQSTRRKAFSWREFIILLLLRDRV